MSKARKERMARASAIAIGTIAIAALALLTYADARRVMAQRATAEATTPQTEHPRAGGRLTADQAARLARALRTTRIDGATIIYVDDDANTNGDGTSWATAFNDLQDGLDAARNLGGAPAEIWVAAGTYKPDRGTGDRSMSFELVNSTGLYGGFAGNETDFNDRDFRTNETILSGDLLGNDVGTSGLEENSWHVVFADDVEDGRLDGCTVSSGEANDEWNDVWEGGGVYDVSSSVVYTNCIFKNNRAYSAGGGLYARVSHSIVSFCQIKGNSVGYAGAGAYVASAEVYFLNTLFESNDAGTVGGALCSSVVTSGRACCPTYLTLANCTAVGNSAYQATGGVYARGVSRPDSRMTILNGIVWGNVDSSGSGESAQLGVDPSTASCWVTEVERTCIQGWTGVFGGVGNTGADPNFVDADGGDYRLQAPSSAIDAGSNGALPVGVVTDLAGGARFVDHPLVPDTGVSTNGLPVVDMGAYEWFDPDCNNNGVEDVLDMSGGTSADCNTNSLPDECDVDFDGDGMPDDCDDDVDGDGVLDTVDACPFSPLWVPVNPLGGPMGDLDDDCLVTLDDYFYFEICLYISGPNGDPGFQDCRDIFDFDGDGDVDLADYAAFARAMAGT